MGKHYKRMTCSEKKSFIQRQIALQKDPISVHGMFCAHADPSDLSSSVETIDDSVSKVVDCGCIFEEECQQLYVADELDIEKRVQHFMNRYSAEQAEEFAKEFAMSEN
ncbi:MAG: hypothetical protein PHR61_03605 [Candidatus Absconditabacteria bacterium]|nr:hypothetical protein [Candidatus Absconditabacteria bacterium]